ETGCTCKKYQYLGKLYPSPGYVDEIIHLYLAQELEFSEQHLDDDEFLDIIKIPLEKAVEMVMSGEIYDSKTQVCILKTYISMKKGSY
ncbi:MAG TPA: ADP-ribose pyrophosphatase, partial [Ruminococcus sp.]|nr:ADP-ribose pyrophosphatase [Ruminococcus sp.]